MSSTYVPHPFEVPLRMSTRISRRRFALMLAGLGSGLACRSTLTEPESGPSRVRLSPRAPSRPITFGLQPIGLKPALPALQRDGLLYVPNSYRANQPLPLVILLHGSTGSGSAWFGSYAQRAEDARVVLLAPDARSYTWDAIQEERFGPDVDFIESAIASTFDRVAIDPTRMALMGFSDGASYALSLGLANGDVFSRVVAYAPGYIVPATRFGKPAFRIFHGTNDEVLPVDRSRQFVVPELRQAGYAVNFTEFAGGHEVPSAVSDAGMQWLMNDWR